MLQGFKDFIMRGNVIELSTAVIVGSAFTAIVTSISDHIINPLIASFGSADVSGFGFYLDADNDATFLDFGAVITSVINFLIVDFDPQGAASAGLGVNAHELDSTIYDLLVASRPDIRTIIHETTKTVCPSATAWPMKELLGCRSRM